MTADLYLAIINTVEAIAICMASGAAVYGIWAWRREAIGKRKMELAEEILEKFAFAKDWIGAARRPHSIGEGTSRPPAEDEDPPTKEQRSAYFVPAERLNKERQLFYHIITLRYLAISYFGNEIDSPFKSLISIHNDIKSASSWLAARTGRSQFWETITGADGAVGGSAHREKLEKTIWQLEPDTEDEITQRLNDAMDQITRICRPHLR